MVNFSAKCGWAEIILWDGCLFRDHPYLWQRIQAFHWICPFIYQSIPTSITRPDANPINRCAYQLIAVDMMQTEKCTEAQWIFNLNQNEEHCWKCSFDKTEIRISYWNECLFVTLNDSDFIGISLTTRVLDLKILLFGPKWRNLIKRCRDRLLSLKKKHQTHSTPQF